MEEEGTFNNLSYEASNSGPKSKDITRKENKGQYLINTPKSLTKY